MIKNGQKVKNGAFLSSSGADESLGESLLQVFSEAIGGLCVNFGLKMDLTKNDLPRGQRLAG